MHPRKLDALLARRLILVAKLGNLMSLLRDPLAQAASRGTDEGCDFNPRDFMR